MPRIVDAAFAVRRALDPGLLESAPKARDSANCPMISWCLGVLVVKAFELFVDGKVQSEILRSAQNDSMAGLTGSVAACNELQTV